MSTPTLYLIRHGESEGNAMRSFLGHTDLDITEKGHMQAEKTANYLKDIYADAIYSSDLLRAYHTAEHTAKLKGMDIIKNKNLREIYAGDWENVEFDELQIKYPDSYGLWRQNVGLSRPDNGESVKDLQLRIAAELKRLSELNMGKSLMIFTHATPIRTFASYCLGKTLEEIKDLPWPSNASVSVFKYHDGKFELIDYSIDDFMGDINTILPPNV